MSCNYLNGTIWNNYLSSISNTQQCGLTVTRAFFQQIWDPLAVPATHMMPKEVLDHHLTTIRHAKLFFLGENNWVREQVALTIKVALKITHQVPTALQLLRGVVTRRCRYHPLAPTIYTTNHPGSSGLALQKGTSSKLSLEQTVDDFNAAQLKKPCPVGGGPCHATDTTGS